MTRSSVPTPDKLASDLATQQSVTRVLQKQLDLFGYHLVDTPLVDPADLFLIKAGDAAISRLISFELPGKRLCLRPEFTVPAAQMYIKHFQERPGVVRLQFAGPILQYATLNHNRINQQVAVGAELLNEHSPAADAEIIALVGKMLHDADVLDWELVIGHSGMIECFLQRYDLDRAMRRLVLERLADLAAGPDGLKHAQEALDAHMTDIRSSAYPSPAPTIDSQLAIQTMLQVTPQPGPTAGRTREEIVQRLLSKQQQTNQHRKTLSALQELAALLRKAQDPASLRQAVDDPAMKVVAHEIITTFKLLDAYGIPADRTRFDLSFTRNLDYYTGIVFEYRTSGDTGAPLLGGGGRYDELVRLLGAGRDVPAVGFMINVDHVMQAQANGRQAAKPQRRAHILIRRNSPDESGDLIAIASQLREQGVAVTTDLASASPRVDSADVAGFTHTLTLEKPDMFLLRNMTDDSVEQFSRQDLSRLRQALEIPS